MTQNHFNKLTPAELERLALLSEECGEVIQVIGKILRHGFESNHPDGGPTNRMLLTKELGDVHAAQLLMIHGGDLQAMAIHEATALKLTRVGQYLHHNMKP